MKTKILSLALVVAMLASMLVVVPVSGATEADGAVTVTNAFGYAGDTVAVDVILTTSYDVYKFQFAFDYDKTKMTLDSVEFQPGLGFWPLEGIAAVDQVMAESPYDNIGWNRAVGAEPLDALGGVVIATMYFTLEADVSGDAFVSIVPSPINNIAIDDGSLGNVICNFDYTSGGVTVLPDSYLPLAPTDKVDFDIEDGVLYEYRGDSTGTVVIPSDVSTIEAMAFNSKSISTLIIPETVKSLAAMAIYRPLKGTTLHVYVLSADTVVAPTSFSTGTRYGSIVVHGLAGSSAAAVTGTSVSFVEETYTKVSVAGSTFVTTASEIPAPGVAVNGDQVTVAWKIGDKTYFPGDMIELDGAVELTPVTIAKPQTSTEVGIKLAENASDLSMRFKATFGVNDYAKLVEIAGEGGKVDLGMLITPARYVAYAGAFTKEALAEFTVDKGETDEKTYTLGANAYVDVALNGYFTKTADEYTFAARLANFSDTTLAKNPDFAAVMYATVTTADGATFTVYGDFNHAANHNVKDVAIDAAKDDKLTTTFKGALESLIGSFTN